MGDSPVAGADADPDLDLDQELERMGESTADVDAGVAASSAPRPIRRYALLERLGEGGMGVVFTAYDARLDRKVALKVLRREESVDARRRFQREARALAKLHHPNVVGVYDAGEVGERPYLAMQLIVGATLRRWLKAAPRGWRDVVRVFAQAGRGLAAAHAAGLIHRDVKPDNVLVDEMGAVRVADFGLVRVADEAAGAEERAPVSGAAGEAITRAPLGTPRYRAPEGNHDARSDQYSFCFALGEAVERKAAPAFVRRVVERGTQRDPAARFPDMAAVVAALEHDPRRRWRVAATIAGVLAIGAAAAIGGARLAAPPEVCTGFEQRLAGVWDARVRDEMRATFAKAGRAYAADAFERAARRLDDYARTWAAMRDEACRATAVRHEQSQALLDLRMRCLDRRLDGLATTTKLLAARPDAVDNAALLVGRLEPLAGCADADALSRSYPPPSDPALRQRIDALEKASQGALVLLRAGHAAEAKPRLVAALPEARTTAYPPLVAEILLDIAEVEADLDHGTGEEEDLVREAIRTATQARDPRIEARAWAELILLQTFRGHPADAVALALAGEGAAERSSDPAARAVCAANLGSAERQLGKLDEARHHLEAAVVFAEQAYGKDGIIVANYVNSLALVLRDQGRFDDAVAAFRRALAIYEVNYGPEHYGVAGVLMNLGTLDERAGHFASARLELERAVAVLEKARGPEHIDVARALTNLSALDVDEMRLDDGEAHARRSLVIKEKVLGPNHILLASSLTNLAEALRRKGHSAEARPFVARNVDIAEQAPGHKAELADALVTLAAIDAELGRLDDAAREIDRAQELHPAEHLARLEVASTLLAIKRPKQAIALLDGVEDTDPVHDAERDFTRARGLFDLGDRDAAWKLAHDVDVRLAALGAGGRWLRPKVTVWLDAHGPK